MSVSVCAGWKYCSITISPLACSFWLVLNVCCGKASAGDAGKCKPNSALSCGSAMRVLVFLWASTVAPAACRLALLSVWSTCQCVSITVFSGALPSPSSVSFNFGQAGIRNVSTTILPSGPFNTTTFPPGPESNVRFSASGCDWIGALPICARMAARESVGGVEACCRRPGTPALKRLAGKSCASNALPANAAELRNISRRVLCSSKNFGLIFFRLSSVDYVRLISYEGIAVEQDQVNKLSGSGSSLHKQSREVLAASWIFLSLFQVPKGNTS